MDMKLRKVGEEEFVVSTTKVLLDYVISVPDVENDSNENLADLEGY